MGVAEERGEGRSRAPAEVAERALNGVGHQSQGTSGEKDGRSELRRDIFDGHCRSSYRCRGYRYGVGRQGTDPVGNLGNGRGVGATGQVVVGQGMMIARGESQAGRKVTGIRGEKDGVARPE